MEGFFSICFAGLTFNVNNAFLFWPHVSVEAEESPFLQNTSDCNLHGHKRRLVLAHVLMSRELIYQLLFGVVFCWQDF